MNVRYKGKWLEKNNTKFFGSHFFVVNFKEKNEAVVTQTNAENTEAYKAQRVMKSRYFRKNIQKNGHFD